MKVKPRKVRIASEEIITKTTQTREVPRFWKLHEVEDLEHFTEPSQCKTRALTILERMHLHDDASGIAVVCGPISTPRHLSIREKINRFKNAIKFVALKTNGLVFDQMIFERVFLKFQKAWHKKYGHDSYPIPILEDFYRPVFESGFIKTAYFIPGWQESFGASWERKEMKRLGIPFYDLMDSWEEELVAVLRTLR